MSAPTSQLRDELIREFDTEVKHYRTARVHCAMKDTPANRAAMTQALDNLNAVLDLWLENK